MLASEQQLNVSQDSDSKGLPDLPGAGDVPLIRAHFYKTAAGLIAMRAVQDKYAAGGTAMNGNGNGNCVPAAKGERLAEVWIPQDTSHQAAKTSYALVCYVCRRHMYNVWYHGFVPPT